MALVAAATYQSVKAAAFASRAVVVQAEVMGLGPPGGGTSASPCPTVALTSPSGERLVASLSRCRQPVRHRVGDRLAVQYDPAEPSTVLPAGAPALWSVAVLYWVVAALYNLCAREMLARWHGRARDRSAHQGA